MTSKKKAQEPVYMTLSLTKTQSDELLWSLRSGDSAIWRLEQVEDALGQGSPRAERKARSKRREAIYQIVEVAHVDAFWAKKEAAQEASPGEASQ